MHDDNDAHIGDGALLLRFARERDEAAFAEIVRRHLGLVYAAALRQVGGDAHLAQDVAQLVFTDLARKVSALAARETLAGWLHTSTHHAAANVVRAERRRRSTAVRASWVGSSVSASTSPGSSAAAGWARSPRRSTSGRTSVWR